MASRVRTGILILLMVLAMGLVLVASRSGIGISPDSVSYVAAATSWANGDGLLTFTGEPLTLFPPGLPILLGSLGWFGIPLTGAALVINVLAAGALVLGAYLLGRIVGLSPALALGAAAMVAVAPAMVDNLSMLWTEGLFSVLVLGLLLVVARATRRRAGADWGTILGSAALVWAATAVRYVGVTLVAVVLVGLWLAGRGHPGCLMRAVLATGLALAGPLLIVLRNLVVTGEPLGERYPGSQTIPQAMERAARLWGDYVVQAKDGPWPLLVGLLVLVLLGIGAFVGVRCRPEVLPVAVFLGIYWVAIWWSQGTTRIDVGSDRLGFPAFAPAVVLALVGAAALVGPVRHRLPRTVTVASATVLMAVVVLAALASWRLATDAGEQGRGYAAEDRVRSPLGEAVAALPESSVLASDDPWQVWWWRQAGSVLPLPPTLRQWPQERLDRDRERLMVAFEEGRLGYVIQVTGAEPVLPSSEWLPSGTDLGSPRTYPDGAVLEVQVR